MTDFISSLELSVRNQSVLKLAGITTKEAFLALTRETYRTLPNWISKGWKEIEAVQQSLIQEEPALGMPASDVTVESVYAFISSGLALLEDGLEDKHGNQHIVIIDEILQADGMNAAHIQLSIVAEEPWEDDAPVFKITVERIS